MVKVAHVGEPSTVAVNAEPEAELNTTSSVAIGTDAPLAPPDVADHLAVEDQLPVPPTQYRVAIVYS
jgi:hypothetical protein